MDQDTTWHGCSDIVLDGDPAPPPLRGTAPPPISAKVRCGQTAGWTKMPHGVEVGLDPGDLVFDKNPDCQKKGYRPHPILAHVYCGQTPGWIMMPLGMEENLGLGDVVLDGIAAPPKRDTAPSFRFMSIVAKRLDG